MQITFKAIGLSFSADVSYAPGRPATMYRSNGDPGDPAEPSECEIQTLYAEFNRVKSDALFLLESSVADQIADAAHEAADAAWPLEEAAREIGL